MKNYLVIIILTFGFLFRVVNIVKFPAGFTPDEAAFGYNAYTLLKTGADEWGTPWYKLPFTNLRSFGDYKLPLYAFLTMPSVAIFGLNEFAVRLPNAILGTLAVGAVYLLAKKWFPGTQNWAAFIMAINPWAISLSRGAFEANLVTLFIPLALAVNPLFLVPLVYAYHSGRLLAPLILLFTKPSKIWILVIALCIPAVFSYLGSGSGRVKDVGLWSSLGGVADRRFEARVRGLPDWTARIFSNKAVALISQTSKQYLSYFSPQFLFTNGAGEWTYGMISGRGVLYWLELPLILAFIILIIKSPKQPLLLLLLLLLLAPLPAALAKGPGYAANRAAAMLPFLVLAIALGIQQLLRFKILILILYLTSLIFFLEDYIYHAPQRMAGSMNYGWSESLLRAKPLSERFSQVVFSRGLSEPHIFVAFYWQIDPRQYQKASVDWLEFEKKGLKFLDQYDGYYLGKFKFGDLHFNEPVDKPTLFVGRPEEFPIDAGEYFHIDSPNGRPVMRVVEKMP